MILGIADNHDAASAGFDFIAFGDVLSRVISALGVKVGTNFADESAYVFLGKNHNGVYIGERSENFRPFFGWHHGASFTFQGANGSVAVYGDDQLASEFACDVKVANVANVQDVETAVSESYFISGAAPVGDSPLEFVPGNDFRME